MSNLTINTLVSLPKSNQTELQLANLLKTKSVIQLEVIKLLSNKTVQFKSDFGLINLDTDSSNNFKPASLWLLHESDDNKQLALKPFINSEKAILDRLQAHRTIPLQVTDIKNNTVNFQSHFGELSFPVKNHTALKPGSEWQLVSENDSFYLKNISNKNIKLPATPVTSSPKVAVSDLELQPVKFDAHANQSGSIRSTLLSHKRDAFLGQGNISELFSLLSSPNFKALLNSNKTEQSDSIIKLTEQILSLRLSRSVSPQSLKQSIKSNLLFSDSQYSTQPNLTKISTQSLSSLLQNLKNVILQGDQTSADIQNVIQKSVKNIDQAKQQDAIDYKPYKNHFHNLNRDSLTSQLTEVMEKSLSRIKLLQLTSILDSFESFLNNGTEKTKPQIMMEIPFALSPLETALIGLKITHDGNKHPNEKNSSRWSIDISLDTKETGAINANIKFGSNSVNIVIIAESKEFSELLHRESEVLHSALRLQGINITRLKILHGNAILLQEQPTVGEGDYLDESI